MAEISKIGVKGETYDIKDAVAREAMANIKGGLEELGSTNASGIILFNYGDELYNMIMAANFVRIHGGMGNRESLYPIWHIDYEGYYALNDEPKKLAAFIGDSYGEYTLHLPTDHGISGDPMEGKITLTFYR